MPVYPGALRVPELLAEDLRKTAGEIFARDLAVLSGRKATTATPSAWEAEIAAWNAAISR